MSITLNTVSAQNLHEGQQIDPRFRFMGNGSRYMHTHYAIAFIVNSIHFFCQLPKISDKMHHRTLKHSLPQSLACAHNQ